MEINQATIALLLSVGAGLSTLLGAVVVLFVKGKSEKLITVSLGFAGGVMISVSFLDMLPNAITFLSEHTNHKMGVALAVFSMLIGVLVGALLDRLVPHEKDEHNENAHGNMYRLGMISTLAIAVHNFPEGIATFAAGATDLTLGATVALAIAIHNIPEGVSVAMPVYYATQSKGRAFLYAFISGVSEPIGALLAYFFLLPFLNGLMLGVLFAFVAGIMLYIVIEELIPASRQYGQVHLALIATFTGICLMPLTHIIG